MDSVLIRVLLERGECDSRIAYFRQELAVLNVRFIALKLG
jgi:hypothetical protein